MNERIILRLTEDGRALPINSLSGEGVMLKNETDATPRGLVVEFDQAGHWVHHDRLHDFLATTTEFIK